MGNAMSDQVLRELIVGVLPTSIQFKTPNSCVA